MTASPGCNIRLNLPIRSTIHAVCCGTKRTIVFAGNEGRWKYVLGVPEGEEDPRPKSEEFCGREVDGEVEKGRKI